MNLAGGTGGHPFPGPAADRAMIVAGVIRDSDGRILVSRRRPGTHLEGLWEFPGGKLEPGEDPFSGLARELAEELGVEVRRARPLVAVTHDYPERTVRLWLWEVEAFSGTPRGLEGQPLDWVAPGEMAGLEMPAADRPLVRILDLPALFSISPDPADFGDDAAFLAAWSACLEAGFRLLRLRARMPETRRRLAPELARLCREAGALWLVSGDPEEVVEFGADGFHLTSGQIARFDSRPVPENLLLAASCHDSGELHRAAALGVDFVTVSPVARTATHPDAHALGWGGLGGLVEASSLPVFALGGMSPSDLDRARALGAFGVAGIRAFGWSAA